MQMWPLAPVPMLDPYENFAAAPNTVIVPQGGIRVKLQARGSDLCVAPEHGMLDSGLVLTDCCNATTILQVTDDHYYFEKVNHCLWWWVDDILKPLLWPCWTASDASRQWHAAAYDSGVNIYTWSHPFALTVAAGKPYYGARVELARLDADWDSQKFDLLYL